MSSSTDAGRIGRSALRLIPITYTLLGLGLGVFTGDLAGPNGPRLLWLALAVAVATPSIVALVLRVRSAFEPSRITDMLAGGLAGVGSFRLLQTGGETCIGLADGGCPETAAVPIAMLVLALLVTLIGSAISTLTGFLSIWREVIRRLRGGAREDDRQGWR